MLKMFYGLYGLNIVKLNNRTKKVSILTRSLSGKKNLDCGCGKGDYAGCFNGECLGLDIDLKMLRIVKQKYSEIIRANISHLPFQSNAFDYALASEVIEHLTKKEGYAALKELHRVSKRLVVTTPNRNSWFSFLAYLFYGSENPQHISFWRTKDLKQIGFKVHGCLGWVTAKKIRFRFLASIWDFMAWHFTEVFGGDLVAIKIR